MSELTQIQAALRHAAVRRRLDRALHGLWRGLLAGSVVWLVGLGLNKVLPLPEEVAGWGWLASLLGAAAGAAIGGWRPVSLPVAARLLEDRQALQQRLSTALEIADRPDHRDSPWTRLVLAEAASCVRNVDPRRLLPLHLPRLARWIPVVLIGVIGLGFVPEYRSASHLKAKRDAEIVRDVGRQMAELIRRELERREPQEDAAREAFDEAALTAERLSQARLTKAEAVQDLANAARRLEDEARQLESNPVLRKLQQAARSPSGSSPSAPQALQKQLETMEQRTGGATPDALEKLAEQLQQAQQAATGMQGTAPEQARQEALSQALQQLAQSASDMGLDLAGLNDALEAMKDLQFDRILKDLQLAGTDLEKLRDMARKLDDMKRQMGEMGKTLAEQLERGQAEAAAQTLDRMVKELASSGLTADEMQKVLEEISRAAKPAEEYGSVADLLQTAARQMASGRPSEAATRLAEAAAELRKLARESQDLQQLAEMMEAFKDAQLAVLSDKFWKPGNCKGGACTGCAIHRKGWAHGGKTGKGVGTWAEDNPWMLYYPEITERWDNTGVERPDMAARGHTDRGEGKLSANAEPTKVRGQFSPGPMPSITLKGVSIKGQSSVQYQQAVEAAQSEAQSALNQDQVPRAYRGAVRGYFDDLN